MLVSTFAAVLKQILSVKLYIVMREFKVIPGTSVDKVPDPVMVKSFV